MGVRFVLRVLLSVAVAAVFAAPVGAGTLTAGTTPGGYGFIYNAGSGETNNVVVTRPGEFEVRISDTAGITVASGTLLCESVSATVAKCNPINPYQTVDVINLGNGNDTLSFDAGSYQFFGTVAVRVDAGDGDDSGINGGPGNDLIAGGAGQDFLTGGSGNDTIHGGDASILLTGDGDDILVGGEGNDSITGGLGNDAIDGSNGDDYLDGGYGNDGLQGNAGNDTLQGFAGVDTYIGGDGDDRLEASYHPDVFQGGPGFDTVDYTNWESCADFGCTPDGVVVTIGDGPNDGNYDLDNDGLIYTAQDDVQSDVEAVVGTSRPDTLSGGVGVLDQTFTGAGGNDTIVGGPGTDTAAGEADVNWTLTNTQLVGQGADSLSGIERATLHGGDSANTLDASAFTLGSVTLYGDAVVLSGTFCPSCFTGPDTLIGSPGNDTLYGDVPGYRVFVGTVDKLYSGKQGHDTLIGGAGNDVLIGDSPLSYAGFNGAGNDTLVGGLGDDTIDGVGGFNTVVATADAMHPSLTATNTSLVGLGTDTLSSASSLVLTGDAGNNTLNASAFTQGPVTLDGGPGIDTLQGGSGADTLTGGIGGDTIDGGPSTGDRIVETTDGSLALSDGGIVSAANGNDSLVSVELATLNGGPGANVLNASGFTGAVTVNGGAGADTITGGSEGDTLNGGADGDAVNGGGGGDTVNGDGGADTLNGGAAIDAVNGGDGDDTLDGGPDAVADVLHGNAGSNRVVGSGDSNWTLNNTNLIGNGGNDSLFEIQLATLTGGAGDNTLNASAFTLGGVVLDGGAGNDTLLGGSGPDTLTGGAGLDAFDAGAGDDSVQTRDSENETSIVCGTDMDSAVVDGGDTVDPDCESVDRPSTVPPVPSPSPPPGVALDTIPPNTLLTRGPRAKTTSRMARFVFGSTEAGSTFECKLDRGPFRRCASPKTYRKLKKGKHTFQVRARDAAGNVDGTPAKKTWRIR